jgi:hypothetical protein
VEKPGHELEIFLREFTPRRPRALPATRGDLPIAAPVDRRRNGQRMAAAALLTIFSGASFWFASSTRTTRTTAHAVFLTATPASNSANVLPSAAALGRLALEDPGQFEFTMSAASRRILPYANTESELRQLAKD